MSDNDTPPVNDNDLPDAPGSNPPADEKDWKVEAEKWKSLARTHEKKWQTANDELTNLRNASMSEAEKALENAKTEGRKAALAEVNDKVVKAELKAAAAEAGKKLPDGFDDVLNLGKFIDPDGNPLADKIASFVSTLGDSNGNGLPKVKGIGPQHGDSKGQLTRADLAKMSPSEITKARSEGRLNNLLGIE
jgi:hypothetical protein